MSRVLRLLAHSFVLCMFVIGIAQARSLMLTAVPNMASSSKLRAMYAPLVRYLSTMTGRPVRFHNPYTLNVLGYMVMKHRPAVLFAGPHIIGWAIKHAGYQPVLAGTGHLHFVLVAKKPGITLSALRGNLVCGLSPPNLATLALFAKFRGHVSTPYIMLAHSPKTALAGVLAGRCIAAAVPIKVAQPALAKHVVYTVTDLGTYPDLAFAVSPRLGSKIRMRVVLALRATEARPALAPLARTYHIPGWFHPSDALYTGLSHLLNAYPGFNQAGRP